MTYAERKAAWAAHTKWKIQASLWAAERRRVWAEQYIEDQRAQEEAEQRAKIGKEYDLKKDKKHRASIKRACLTLREAGLTLKQIAGCLEINYTTVHKYLKEVDERHGRVPRRQTQAKMERAVALRNEGRSYQQIADEMGYHRDTVRNWIYRADRTSKN